MHGMGGLIYNFTTIPADNDKLKVGLSVGGTCAVILLVVLVASILAIRVYMRRRAVVTETDGPTKPLLHPVNGANINSTRKKCNGRDTMYVTADVVFTDYGTNTEPKGDFLHNYIANYAWLMCDREFRVNQLQLKLVWFIPVHEKHLT